MHSGVTSPWDPTALTTTLPATGRIDHPADGDKRSVAGSATVSESATLHAPVVLDDDAVVGPGTVVGPDTAVGRNSTVEAGAVVHRSVVLRGRRIAVLRPIRDGEPITFMAAGQSRDHNQGETPTNYSVLANSSAGTDYHADLSARLATGVFPSRCSGLHYVIDPYTKFRKSYECCGVVILSNNQ